MHPKITELPKNGSPMTTKRDKRVYSDYIGEILRLKPSKKIEQPKRLQEFEMPDYPIIDDKFWAMYKKSKKPNPNDPRTILESYITDRSNKLDIKDDDNDVAYYIKATGHETAKIENYAGFSARIKGKYFDLLTCRMFGIGDYYPVKNAYRKVREMYEEEAGHFPQPDFSGAAAASGGGRKRQNGAGVG